MWIAEHEHSLGFEALLPTVMDPRRTHLWLDLLPGNHVNMCVDATLEPMLMDLSGRQTNIRLEPELFRLTYGLSLDFLAQVRVSRVSEALPPPPPPSWAPLAQPTRGKEREGVVRGRWAPPPMEGKGPTEGQRMAIGWRAGGAVVPVWGGVRAGVLSLPWARRVVAGGLLVPVLPCLGCGAGGGLGTIIH